MYNIAQVLYKRTRCLIENQYDLLCLMGSLCLVYY